MSLIVNNYFALLGLSIFHVGWVIIPNLWSGNPLRIFVHFVTSFMTDISCLLLVLDLCKVMSKTREKEMKEAEEMEETGTIPHVVFEEILEEDEEFPLSVVVKRMKIVQRSMGVT